MLASLLQEIVGLTLNWSKKITELCKSNGAVTAYIS